MLQSLLKQTVISPVLLIAPRKLLWASTQRPMLSTDGNRFQTVTTLGQRRPISKRRSWRIGMFAVMILTASMAAIPAKGEVVTHANLTVYPIYEAALGNAGDYISLDEGLKQGSVVITETGGNNARPL